MRRNPYETTLYLKDELRTVYSSSLLKKPVLTLIPTWQHICKECVEFDNQGVLYVIDCFEVIAVTKISLENIQQKNSMFLQTYQSQVETSMEQCDQGMHNRCNTTI